MPVPNLSRENMGSPHADQLSKGFAQLRFQGVLEKEFRDFYLVQSLPRGRISGLVALVLVFAITCIDLIFGAPSDVQTLNILRLGLLCPLLTMTVVAFYLPSMKKHYYAVAAIGVTTAGIVVTYMCVVAAVNGASYLLSAAILVNLYACLFLGLLFYQAACISALLVAAYVGLGAFVGVVSDELLYSLAMLGAAAVIGIIATYNLERAVRLHFLETRLLNELAERDGLTGLYNRRIFDNFMRRLWRQSRREETAIEIVLIDIDYFKIYNDLYGHQVGDDTLKKVAQCIARCAKRPFDFCARYGGEEFVLVLYGPPSEYAQTIPEKIRADVMQLGVPHEGSGIANVVTVSIGVAFARPGTGRSLPGAIQAADEALYVAKKSGRNRIVSKDANTSEVETGKFRAAYRELA
jgi:diguanylate cyclase (GGDEF)-like protein